MPQILYDSDLLQVLYNPAKSADVLVVAFNEIGSRADGESFWGRQFLEKNELSAIGIVSKTPNWFPSAELQKAAPAILQIYGETEYRRKMSYGYSQGGYGALKFGSMLGMDVALALSPQWSIDPADVAHFDDRYIGHFAPGLHQDVAIRPDDLPPVSYLLFDPWATQDSGHIRILEPMPGVRTVLMPFTSHDTVRMLTQAGLARTLIDLAVRPGGSAAELRRLIRTGRRSSYTYWAKRDWHIAHALPNWKAAHAQASDVLTELRGAVLPDAATEFLPTWRNLMRDSGPEIAAAFAAAALARSPGHDGIRLHLVRSLIDSGRTSEAMAELGIARGRAGRDRWLWELIEQSFSRLGMPDDAADASRVVASLG